MLFSKVKKLLKESNKEGNQHELAYLQQPEADHGENQAEYQTHSYSEKLQRRPTIQSQWVSGSFMLIKCPEKEQNSKACKVDSPVNASEKVKSLDYPKPFRLENSLFPLAKEEEISNAQNFCRDNHLKQIPARMMFVFKIVDHFLSLSLYQ